MDMMVVFTSKLRAAATALYIWSDFVDAVIE
jgi:hypothetical protein